MTKDEKAWEQFKDQYYRETPEKASERNWERIRILANLLKQGRNT
jgi:hypothetical protein